MNSTPGTYVLSIHHFPYLWGDFLQKNKKKESLNIFLRLLPCTAVICGLLLYPRSALHYAGVGLNAWFHQMIPTLFPFMVITGIMIRMGLTEHFAGFFRPFLSPLFSLRNDCLYVIIIGFLCGFPMGARVCAEMYDKGKLSRQEAQYLLSFCNNIGPVFFVSFVMATLPTPVFAGTTATISMALCLLGMYGLPVIYGILLRHTTYRQLCSSHMESPQESYRFAADTGKPLSFAAALDEAVSSGLDSIAKLGGYMIFFNMLNLFPALLFSGLPANIREMFLPPLSLLLEITGGIASFGKTHPFLTLTLLPFGGASCIAQTYSMIAHTDLSVYQYVRHKLIQTAVTGLYFYFTARILL